MLPQAYEQWAQSASGYFKENYGLNGAMALDSARLYVVLWANGLNPRPTSGWRDPSKQAAMRAAWDRGDRAGLRTRPADPAASDHCKTTFLGSPASNAFDMVSSNEQRAAELAKSLGIGCGWYFANRDPGHYYSLRS